MFVDYTLMVYRNATFGAVGITITHGTDAAGVVCDCIRGVLMDGCCMFLEIFPCPVFFSLVFKLYYGSSIYFYDFPDVVGSIVPYSLPGT